MSDYDLIQFLRDKVAKRGKNEKMYRQLLEMACGDESEPPEPELKPCTMCGSTKLVSVLYCHHCSSESGWFSISRNRWQEVWKHVWYCAVECP
jgi:hypothetical protein